MRRTGRVKQKRRIRRSGKAGRINCCVFIHKNYQPPQILITNFLYKVFCVINSCLSFLKKYKLISHKARSLLLPQNSPCAPPASPTSKTTPDGGGGGLRRKVRPEQTTSRLTAPRRHRLPRYSPQILPQSHATSRLHGEQPRGAGNSTAIALMGCTRTPVFYWQFEAKPARALLVLSEGGSEK